MNTNLELKEFAKELRIPLVAVVSKDELVKLSRPKPHQGYIVNLQDRKDGFGTHWVAIAVLKNSQAVYFDSFGIVPPLDVLDFLKGYTISYNHDDIQSIETGYCGLYCLYFLWYLLVHKASLQQLQKLFSEQEEVNLKRLTSLLSQITSSGGTRSKT